ncbi:MAG: universal stress protein [Maribacter sp.]|uniref:universal stress protein n=1 Tax=Maribacter sp. TaxID=1897614 RepID=UPI003C7297E9
MLNILLPTDFSVNAQKAIDYAVRLFEKEECIFYVLHAYHDAPSDVKTKADLENDLKHLVEILSEKKQNQKHLFKSVFLIESVVNALNITMMDKAIDYTFMGNKGVSSLFNVFMGSNTVRAISQLDSGPIIAVPTDYDCDPPEEIVFANNFKHRFITAELTPLIKLTKLWDSTLSVVHISSEKALEKTQKQNQKALKLALKELRTRFSEVQLEVSITSSLYTLGKENKKIGMIALFKTKHGFLENLFHEPVVRKMTFNTEVPLLILPEIA